MTWSKLAVFKARVPDSAVEGQQAEGGANHNNACGPAVISVLMQLLGYPDVEPQATPTSSGLTPAAFVGTTTPQQLNAMVAAHYANPPAMEVHVGGDPVATLAAWGSRGLLAVMLTHSNGAAVLQPYDTGIGHWVLPLADDGQNLTLWNPEWGRLESHPYDFIRKTYAGFLDLCTRPVEEEDMNPEVLKSLARALVDLAYGACDGRDPESVQARDDWVQKILSDPTQFEWVIVQIMDSPEALGTVEKPGYRRRLLAASLGQDPLHPGQPPAAAAAAPDVKALAGQVLSQLDMGALAAQIAQHIQLTSK